MGLLDSFRSKENKLTTTVSTLLQECDMLYSQNNLAGELQKLAELYELLKNNYQNQNISNRLEISKFLDLLGIRFMNHVQRYDYAYASFEMALNINPNDENLWIHLAMTMLDLNQNLDNVLQAVEKAISIKESSETWGLKGDVLAKMGRIDEAIQAYISAQNLDDKSTIYIDKASQLAPDNLDLLVLKMRMLLNAGNIDEASQILASLINREPNRAELWIIKVELDMHKNDIDGALNSVDKAISIYPDNSDYYVLKGNIIMEEKKWDLALNCYNIALTKDPNHINALTGKANTLAMLNKVPDLLEVRRRISAVDPDNNENWKQRMFLAKSLNLYDEANICAEAVLKRDPNDLEARDIITDIKFGTKPDTESKMDEVQMQPSFDLSADEEKLRILKESGDIDGSINCAKDMLSKDPNNKVAILEIARFYSMNNAMDEGLTYFDKYVKLYPDDVNVSMERATLLYSLKRYDEAIAATDAILNKHESGEVWLLKGQILQEYASTKNNVDKADIYKEVENAFNSGLRLYGHAVPRLLEAKGKFYLTTGRYSESLSVFELLTSTSPLNIDGIIGMANSFIGLKNYPKALDMIDKALQYETQNIELWKTRGNCYEEMSQFENALSSYKQALVIKPDNTELMGLILKLLIKLNRNDEALSWVNNLLAYRKDYYLYAVKGDILVSLSRINEAIDVYKIGVSVSNDIDLMVNLAKAEYIAGNIADTDNLCKEILEMDENNINALSLHAHILYGENKFEEALKIVNNVLEVDKKNLDILKLKLFILKELRMNGEYLKLIDLIISIDSSDSSLLLEKAKAIIKTDKKEEAEDLLKKVISANPQNRIALVTLAELYLSEKKYNEALNLGEILVAADNNSYDGWNIKTNALVEMDRLNDAMTLLNNALVSSPHNNGLLVIGGNVLFKKGRRDEAEIYYRRALEVDPENINALKGIGKLKLQLNNIKGAKEFVLKALKKGETDPELWLMLATINEQMGLLDDAIDDLKKVINLENGEEGYERLGELYKSTSKFDSAEKYFEMALKYYPEKYEIEVNRGECLEHLKRYDEALACYDRVITHNPNDKYTWNTKGLLHLQLKRYEEAIKCFDTAIKIDPRFQSAIESKRVCEEKVTESSIESYSKKVLELEFKSGRPLTKQEIFLHCGVPFPLLDKVVSYITILDKMDVLSLTQEDVNKLDDLSLELFKFYVRKSGFIEPRNIALSEVVGYLPRLNTFETKQLLSYIKGVMELEESRIPIIDGIDDLLRKALSVPNSSHNLIAMAVNYGIGILKARALEKGLKMFENYDSGNESKAPLTNNMQPTIAPTPPTDTGINDEKELPVLIENETTSEIKDNSSSFISKIPVNNKKIKMEDKNANEERSGPVYRCAICGGKAYTMHDCGTPLCDRCISIHSGTCPKCGLPILRNTTSFDQGTGIKEVELPSADTSTKRKKRKKEPMILKATPGIVNNINNTEEHEKNER